MHLIDFVAIVLAATIAVAVWVNHRNAKLVTNPADKEDITINYVILTVTSGLSGFCYVASRFFGEPGSEGYGAFFIGWAIILLAIYINAWLGEYRNLREHGTSGNEFYTGS